MVPVGWLFDTVEIALSDDDTLTGGIAGMICPATGKWGEIHLQAMSVIMIHAGLRLRLILGVRQPFEKVKEQRLNLGHGSFSMAR